MYLINVESFSKEIRQNIECVSWMFPSASDKELVEGDQLVKIARIILKSYTRAINYWVGK